MTEQLLQSSMSGVIQVVPTAEPRHGWSDSAESILARLEDRTTDPQERDAAVLFAGSTAFTDEQRPRLLSALGAYITQHRFTRDDDRITGATGTASFALSNPTSGMHWFQGDCAEHAVGRPRLTLSRHSRIEAAMMEVQLAQFAMARDRRLELRRPNPGLQVFQQFAIAGG